MPEHELQDENASVRNMMKTSIEDVGPYRKIMRIWQELADMIEHEIDVSGRLRLVLEKCGNYRAEKEDEDGSFIRCQPNELIPFICIDGINPINKSWRNVPTLIMDATLPGIGILQKYFANVKVVADINIKAEHAHVRQVYNAPTSSKKLKVASNREMLLRYIMLRWFAHGCGKTLVVTQMEFAKWLINSKRLPANVFVEHYNAVSGVDSYKDVRLLMCIGRTEPTPLAMETDAGALSGVARESVVGPGDWWYPQADYELAPGVTVKCSYHPDPLSHEVHFQSCIANIVQALGRARAINRDAAHPVAIEILANLFLPIALDELVEWQTPSAVAAMLKDRIVVTSPSDMMKAWPSVFKSEDTALRALRAAGLDGSAFPNGQLQAFRYQHAGKRQKWRRGWHDPDVVPNPAAWLQGKLGVAVEVEALHGR